MDKQDPNLGMMSLAVSTAMAGALLSGCATGAAPTAQVSATQAQAAMAEGRVDRGLRLAEQAVQAEPTNAGYRAMLGRAYLDAGRFASAETSFADAMTLGDSSPRTALSLALAQTAQAKYRAATGLLNQWEGQINTADLGLALALAGQPERGIHLMSNAIRGGDNSMKMRQNLAYAYAVAGRWREARVMAAQDVPADQVGARMAQWAALASPDAYQLRVAQLLGAPTGVADQGQPVELALGNTPSVPQLAAEARQSAGQELAALPAAAPAAAPAPAAPLPTTGYDGRYAAASHADTGRMAVPARGSELPAVGRASDSAQTRPTDFATAFAVDAAPTMSGADGIRFVSQPVVQHLPGQAVAASAQDTSPAASAQARVATRSVPLSATQPVVAAAPAQVAQAAAPDLPSAADGTHLVRLGSFSTEQGARRAWTIYVSRHPRLADHEMVISEAMVHGRKYYRVSAGGFTQTASRAMCRTVDQRGGDGCITWAANAPLPGALPARADTGVRLARRD